MFSRCPVDKSSTTATRLALLSLQELVDSSHILFGTDYPFAVEQMTMETVKAINSFSGFDAQILSAIEKDNALNLFPRLQRI